MTHSTPGVTDGMLAFAGAVNLIAVGSTAWLEWLSQPEHCSFHFRDAAGEFTARKERKQRGSWYWVAYRQIDGKLHKTYLGKSETLTLERLQSAARKLAEPT